MGGWAAPKQPRKHAADPFRSRTAHVRAAQSAGTLTNEKTDKAQRTHDTPTNRSNAISSGGRFLEQTQRTSNHKTTNTVIGTDNK